MPRHANNNSSVTNAYQNRLASLAKRKIYPMEGTAASGYHIKIPEEEKEMRTANIGFGNLTQVCRKIRREFLPLYMSTVTNRMCHVDLKAYLEGVLLPECQRAGERLVPLPTGDCIDTKTYWNKVHKEALLHRAKIARTWLVDCKSWEEKEGTYDASRPQTRSFRNTDVDILPFLKFCATAPGIRVELGVSSCECSRCNDWSGLEDIVDALFGVAQRPKLALWLDESVSAINLQWPPNLSFKMKKGHGAIWMGEWNSFENDGIHGMEEWGRERLDMELSWQISGSLSFQCYRTDWDLPWGTDDHAESVWAHDNFFERVPSEIGGRQRASRTKQVGGRCKLEKIGRGHGRHK